MTHTTRIYNIHMVNGRVLSTPNCPIMMDQNMQPLAYFIVPVAVEKQGELYVMNNRFQNVRINQQNVLFVDETVARNEAEATILEELFTVPTFDTQSL